MFQFTAFPFHILFIHIWMTGLSPARFPHSDIHGSIPICDSPWLFAACHVLLRLPVPRHSPCALSCLTVWYILYISECSSVYISSFFDVFLSSWLFSSSMFSFQGASSLVYLISHTNLWRLRDSNSRPPACKAGALPSELNPRRWLLYY